MTIRCKRLKSTSTGTEAVLKAALHYECRTLIASTSEVYGKGSRIPFAEDDDVLLGSTMKSRWSYAASKMIDEFLALAYHKEYGLPVAIFRLFNTVGPRQRGRYGMVIPRLVAQALAGEPMTVYGTGEQQRCFCDVRDVVEGIVGLSEHREAIGRVFNIGSTEETTILSLAERIRTLAGSSSPITRIRTTKRTRRASKTCSVEFLIPPASIAFSGGTRARRLDEILASVIEAHRLNQSDGFMGLGVQVLTDCPLCRLVARSLGKETWCISGLPGPSFDVAHYLLILFLFETREEPLMSMEAAKALTEKVEGDEELQSKVSKLQRSAGEGPCEGHRIGSSAGFEFNAEELKAATSELATINWMKRRVLSQVQARPLLGEELVYRVAPTQGGGEWLGQYPLDPHGSATRQPPSSRVASLRDPGAHSSIIIE